MDSASTNTRGIFEILIMMIAVSVIFELFYVPDVGAARTIGAFPAFNLLGFRLTISEIFLYVFIGIGLLYILEKMRRMQTLEFAPSAYTVIPWIIFLLVLLSLLTGLLVFFNPDLIQYSRKVLIPILFYFVYINVDIPHEWDKTVFKVFSIGIFILCTIYFLDYFKANIFKPLQVGRAFANMFGSLLYMQLISILAFNMAAARILLKKFNIWWAILLLISFGNIVLRIEYKSCIFAFLISCIVLFYFKAKSSKFGTIKAIAIVSTTLILIAFIFINMQQKFKDRMAQYVAHRYLKVENVMTTQGFDEEMLAAASEKDLSTNRFGIWTYYFKESLKGYGLAPYGFGHAAEVRSSDNIIIGNMKGTHNLLLFYAYHTGLLTAGLVLLLILIYMYLNTKILLNLKTGIYDYFLREDLIAIFAFTLSVLAVNMVTTSLMNSTLAWLFWFCVAILVRRYNFLKDATTKEEYAS